MARCLGAILSSAAVVLAVFAVTIMGGHAGAATVDETLHHIGLLPPRVDGILEPGRPGTIAEWDDDSLIKEISLAGENGTTVTGELRTKSIGNGFYFGLSLEAPRRPELFLFTDLDADGRADQVVGMMGGRNVEFVVTGNEWTPAQNESMTLARVAITQSGAGDRWTGEIGLVPQSTAPNTGRVGFALALMDPVTRDAFWYPAPEGLCVPQIDPPRFPPPDKICFIPYHFKYGIDPSKLVTLRIASPSVTRIEVTQAIQTADQQMPLAAGKTSLARVFVNPGAVADEVEVTLYGSRLAVLRAAIIDGRAVVYVGWQYLGSLTQTFLAPPSPSRANMADSANFRLPTEWTEAGSLRLEAQVRSTSGVPVPDTTWLLGASRTASFSFKATHDLVTYVVPVDEGSVVSDATISSFTQNMTTVYPMANPSYPVLGSDVLGHPWTGTDDQLLADLTEIVALIVVVIILQVLFGNEVTFQVPDQVFGLRNRNLGGLSDPVWCGGDSFAAWGGLSASSRELVMAHEIQHNIGPGQIDFGAGNCRGAGTGYYGYHIGGCGADASDAAWRSAYGSNDFTAHDLGWDPTVADPERDQRALVPATYPDFMSYCQSEDISGVPVGTTPTKWISTYRWENLFGRLQQWATLKPGARSHLGMGEVPSIRVVRGTIPASGTPTVLPTFETPGVLPPDFPLSRGAATTSAFKVVVRDSAGVALETAYVDPVFTNAEGGPRPAHPFVFMFPDNGQVASVELANQSGSVLQSYRHIDSPLVAFTSVPNAFARGVPARVAWSAQGPNSSFLLSQLEYSPDNATWFQLGQPTMANESLVTFVDLPGSDHGRLRVRVTNGLDTAMSVSATFSVPTRRAQISISGSPAAQSVLSRYSFRADVTAPDTGGVGEDRIEWLLDGAPLGRGSMVSFDVRGAGNHILSVAYTDSSGSASEASVNLEATNRPFPTLAALAEFEAALVSEQPPVTPTDYTWLLAGLGIVAICVIVIAIVWYRRQKP